MLKDIAHPGRIALYTSVLELFSGRLKRCDCLQGGLMSSGMLDPMPLIFCLAIWQKSHSMGVAQRSGGRNTGTV